MKMFIPTILALGIAVTACGSSDGDSSHGTSEPAPAPTPAPTPAPSTPVADDKPAPSTPVAAAPQPVAPPAKEYPLMELARNYSLTLPLGLTVAQMPADMRSFINTQMTCTDVSYKNMTRVINNKTFLVATSCLLSTPTYYMTLRFFADGELSDVCWTEYKPVVTKADYFTRWWE